MRINDVGTVPSDQNVHTKTSQVVANQKELAEQSVDMSTIVQDNSSNEDSKKIIDDKMLEDSIKQANKSLQNYNRYIERSVHEKTKAIMYVVKDTTTNEVIREFPPKKIQDMIAKMWELAGLFVDEKA